jgi:hypothetical protein
MPMPVHTYELRKFRGVFTMINGTLTRAGRLLLMTKRVLAVVKSVTSALNGIPAAFFTRIYIRKYNVRN